MTKILIIDDEPTTIEMVKKRLEANKFEVVVAKDGTQGLAVAKSERPDLMVVDVMMPDIDGYTLVRQRAHNWHS